MRYVPSSSFLILLFFLVPFCTLAQYQINGNAIQTSCNCYRLTTASNNQNGSVWNVNLLDLSNSFNFTFDVFLGCSDGGADGLAFVLQPLSVNAGSVGGGIGYAGINPSLAVEMDTYQNGGEPSFDHMAIQKNGDVSHGGTNTLAGPVQISPTNPNVEDCAWHQLNVVWDATTNTMTAYFDNVLRLTYTGDIVSSIFGGNPHVYWGFTAATGGANNEHAFCNALNPAFIITSPQQCEGYPVDFESASAVATGQITAFDWDFGDGTTGSGGQVSHTFSASGTYDIQLTIASEGCTATSTTQITINALPSFSLGTDEALCNGETIQLNATGLSGNETLQWNPATGLDNAAISNPNASPTSTTTYTLGVIDANGCPNTDNITITVNPLPTASAGPDKSICELESMTMAGSGGTQYSWAPATGLADATSASTQASPSATTTYTLTVTDGNGCTDTDDMTITVNPLPTVNAGTDDSMCSGQTVQLGASGTSTYNWTPSTGLNNPTSANPIFSGTVTTVFTVTGTDGNGCTDSDDVEITVFATPVAAFSSPADVCVGDPTIITDNSSGDGIQYNWDLGDGSGPVTDPEPDHTYATDGTYSIVLTLTDANGCSASANSTATVYPLPAPAMNILNGESFCEHEVIQFHNLSPGSVADVWWDFGNNAFLPAFPNATSTLNDPTFSYTNSAFSPFTVTLGITDAAGCYGQTQTTLVIRDKPIAKFTAPSVCEGMATQFTDVSTVNGSTINSWKWNFGDGTGVASAANPFYPYPQAGTYQTSLIVQTDHGCIDTLVQDVVVNSTPVISLAGIDTCLNDETVFVNSSTPQNSTITDWNWDFGDGSAYTGITAAHTYTTHGIYTVTLTATSDSGCVASGTTKVEVFPNPAPAFRALPDEGCTPLEVLFANQSIIASGQNTTFEWDLGDGTLTTAMSPQHTYSDSGYYSITLLVTSTKGCSTLLVEENAIRANITPVANFSQNATTLSLLDAEVLLTDASKHALAWEWSLGDGTTSTETDPVHTYAQPGTYTLELTVTNGNCTATSFGTVKVEPIFTFYIPSAFTPDDDGINDTFFGQGEGFQTYNLQITDRWGDLIFESNDSSFPWDGTLKGKQVQTGVYIYKFQVIDLFGTPHEYVGNVKLLR